MQSCRRAGRERKEEEGREKREREAMAGLRRGIGYGERKIAIASVRGGERNEIGRAHV